MFQDFPVIVTFCTRVNVSPNPRRGNVVPTASNSNSNNTNIPLTFNHSDKFCNGTFTINSLTIHQISLKSESMDDDEQPCPSTSLHPPPPSSSLLLKDITNFKTPKRSSQPPNFQSPCTQKYFTAYKNTPKSSASVYSRGPPSTRSKSAKAKTAAARRLKSLELEQSKSAYKSQLKKEQSLKSFSKSLTVWVNFLLENPKSCGCDWFDSSNAGTTVARKGKREGGEVMTWRNPKRQRDAWWRGENDEVECEAAVSESKYVTLRKSLNDVCSLEDLEQRMRIYLSLGCCKEIFDIMSRVTKVSFLNLLKLFDNLINS